MQTGSALKKKLLIDKHQNCVLIESPDTSEFKILYTKRKEIQSEHSYGAVGRKRVNCFCYDC